MENHKEKIVSQGMVYVKWAGRKLAECGDPGSNASPFDCVEQDLINRG